MPTMPQPGPVLGAARLLLAALLVTSCLETRSMAARPGSASRAPNILFLLADDLRWNALGCMGDPVIHTPNLDALANRGTLFRQHFVTTSICCVSRASILSGQYARRHKINDFVTPFAPEAFAQAYPSLLRDAGYRTGFVGKFGVGKVAPKEAFDFWRGTNGPFPYFKKGDDRHLTQRTGDDALEFLKTCDGKSPFCLSVCFFAPHAD